MTTSGNRKLAGDGGEDELDLISEPDENGDGNDRDKCEDQCVLHQGLAFFVLPLELEDVFLFHSLILSF